MNDVLKKISFINIMPDVLLILFGILLLNLKIALVIDILVIPVGAFFILKGIVEVCKYIMARGVSDFYKEDIIFGMASILIGILVILLRNVILNMFSIGVAIYIIYGAIKYIDIAIKLKKLDLNQWIFMLLISIVMLAFGIAILFNKRILVATCAIFIIIYSILDLIENIIFIKISKEIFE